MRAPNYKFNAFLFAYLIMASGCGYSLFSSSNGDILYYHKAGENPIYQLTWLLLYLVLIFKIMQQRKIVAAMVLSSGLLLALLISATLSYLVNGFEVGSLVKFGMYFVTIMFAAWITTLDNVDGVFESLFQVGVLILILHFASYPLLSSVNYDDLNRTTIIGTRIYAGLFGHKQLAGEFFSLNVLVCLTRLLSNKQKTIVLVIIALNLFALLLAGASGAVLSLCAAVSITIGMRLIIARKAHLATIYWTFAAFGVLMLTLVGASSIFELVGRDTSLTGRAFLASLWVQFFLERPFLGYGFANFFTGLPDAPAIRLWQIAPTQQYIGTFESSYLEALIQFGLIGALVFALILLRAVVTAVQFASRSESIYKFAPLSLVILIIVLSFSDGALMLHNHIYVVIMFWAYFGLEKSFSKKHNFAQASKRLRATGRRRMRSSGLSVRTRRQCSSGKA